MARYAFDRLSAQDASFLWAETAREPMHVGAVGILEAGPLRTDVGGIDIDRFRQAVEAVLHWIPRYRQLIDWTPIEGWPVWVDDRHFDLAYHIRHVALPKPGTLAQLKELSGRILARRLDRKHPLWEMWVIEGLEGGEQFALINKVHHCMIDGAAGADLSQILMSPSQDVDMKEPEPYFPRPAPGRLELLTDTLQHRAGQPLGLLGKAAALLNKPDAAADGLRRRARAIGELVDYALQPASATPINGTLSPHRRFDWLTMPLGDLLDLRGVLACTVNDIVLATVAGAVRSYLIRHRVELADVEFRVAAPVSTRKEKHAKGQGNHVSTWIVPLPLAEADPLARLRAIRDVTGELKRKQAALAIDSLMAAAEYMPPALIARGATLAQGPINMLVTNVPGPHFPLYQVGAKLLGMYPVVPLMPGSGLGIALFSYEGKLCWGINADYELVPDLDALAEDVRTSFEELRAATVSEYLEQRTVAAEEKTAKAEAKPRTAKKRPARRKAAGKKSANAGGRCCFLAFSRTRLVK
ncbi:MAG: wax ester/triacylglycerol synthase family O-acyltransferase [Deltaproteobacteria bacterium]|nr:wax ester/triacylglycerol synthase family O-acyltransferase [Deltaproteobacteria bacterium]